MNIVFQYLEVLPMEDEGRYETCAWNLQGDIYLTVKGYTF